MHGSFVMIYQKLICVGFCCVVFCVVASYDTINGVFFFPMPLYEITT
jgi:hypothetical protein